MSVIAADRTPGKRSIRMLLTQDDDVWDVGNLAIPENQTVPAPGEIVEVRYLYASRATNKLIQPVLLGRRHDVYERECLVAQLVYKT